MSIESDIFLRFSFKKEKLVEYGFTERNGKLVFEKVFLNGEFKAVINIQKNGKISGTVYDIENDEEYLPLRYEYEEGAFVGKIREAYTNILKDIRKNCCNENFFISKQGNRIAQLVKEKYNDKPLFMWEDTPTAGVFKNPETGKWYGIIMYIKRNRIGEPSDKQVEILNLKLDTNKIQKLLKQSGFYPAYHMNKKYWITITLDDTLDDKTIMKYINESHEYTVKKKK